MIDREQLFALASLPIGSPAIQAAADAALRQGKSPKEAIAASKRAQRVWLPEGKRSANTSAARDHERELRARNLDLEDAVAAVGGSRGSMRGQ